MNPEWKHDIEKRLTSVPDHTIAERSYVTPEKAPSIHFNPFPASPGGKGNIETYSLYPGITLSFLDLAADQASFHHAAWNSVIEINYCRYGRIGWEMGNKTTLYLGPGDCSIHTMSLCAQSTMMLPLGYYEGLTIFADLHKLTAEPPGLLQGTGITGESLREKFCPDGTFSTFPGDERTDAIFRPLFDLPEQLRFPYFKLKAQELLLELHRLPKQSGNMLTQYQAGQIHTIRQIHEQLMQHLDQRITIETLSRQYLMNPTTLKEVFKTVYGTSIAAHMKEHRMEKAAQLLRNTESSIAQIAKAVGYESQSKFTAAFKDTFGMMPSLYRKTYMGRP